MMRSMKQGYYCKVRNKQNNVAWPGVPITLLGQRMHEHASWHQTDPMQEQTMKTARDKQRHE